MPTENYAIEIRAGDDDKLLRYLRSPVAVTAIAAVVSQAVGRTTNQVIDAVSGKQRDEDAMYAGIGRAISSYNDALAMKGIPVDTMSPQNFIEPVVLPASRKSIRTVPRRFLIDGESTPRNFSNATSTGMAEKILSARGILEEAKSETTCKYCKKHIAAAIKAVDAETKIILTAADKQKNMQELKRRGQLPDKSWDDLDATQKQQVTALSKSKNIRGKRKNGVEIHG
jgi:copper chaperone CopZ